MRSILRERLFLFLLVLISAAHSLEEDGEEKSENDPGVEQPATSPDVVETTTTEPTSTTTKPGTCAQEAELARCLGEGMKEWLPTLHALKDNMVIINETQCKTRDTITKCLTSETKCDHDHIVALTARVTDAALQKQDSGNWLRSYFVANYLCSEKGLQQRATLHTDCLKNDEIGHETYKTIDKMDQHIKSDSKAAACVYLKSHAEFSAGSISVQCTGETADQKKIRRHICDTVAETFLQMYPSKFKHGCDEPCKEVGPSDVKQPVPTVSGTPSGQNGPQTGDGQSGGGGGGQGVEATTLGAHGLSVCVLLMAISVALTFII